MKKIIILLLVFCLTVFAFAEDKPYRHGLSLNYGGPSSKFHAEYQYQLIAKEKHHLGVSAGVGYIFGGVGIPIGVQYRFGKIHQLETGLYYSQLASSVTTSFNISLRLGYRFNYKQFFAHAYVSPWMGVSYSGSPWMGFGIGMFLDSF
ncbi:MAG: porin family protein [Candidatus Marinimicrobia bacterium]|nr:porin family protein [Candidatus Neomarinimicrobiota bacterium]